MYLRRVHPTLDADHAHQLVFGFACHWVSQTSRGNVGNLVGQNGGKREYLVLSYIRVQRISNVELSHAAGPDSAG